MNNRLGAASSGIQLPDPTSQMISQQGPSILLNDNVIPSASDFDQLLMPVADASDVVWWNYYDSVAIPSAASKTGALFLNPNNGNPWTSNLTNSGRLEGGERFLVFASRIEIEHDSSTLLLNAVTVKEILRQSYFEFWLASKAYSSYKGTQFIDGTAPFELNTSFYQTRPFQTIQLPLKQAIGKEITFQYKYNLGTTPALSGNWLLFGYIIGVRYRGVQ